MVKKETIAEFRDAIQEELGVALNIDEAQEILMNWVGYFDLLAKIDHREQSDWQRSSASPL